MNDKCPKCEGEMIKGYIADRTDMNMIRKQSWTAGNKPKVNRKSKEVAAYCCVQCGYLELYAE